MGFSKRYTTERNKKSHFENIKPHNPSTKDWYIPVDMEEGDYLMMDPACEVKKRAPGERMMGMES